MRHNAEPETEGGFVHTPVMHREVLRFAAGAAGAGDSVIVDCTLGEGGHSEMLLRELDGVRVIAFERDPEILERARRRLSTFGARVEFVNRNFDEVVGHLAGLAGRVSCFLYDFGISSYHLDASGRGFSLQRDEPLDMRLDGRGAPDARHILNKYSEIRLTDIIKKYGEERWAAKIARAICRRREEKPFETTGELAGLVLEAIPRKFHVRNIHPATRVFQALRIEVNDELGSIERSLAASIDCLAAGGRCVAISFHSLEDRIVKNVFRSLAKPKPAGPGEPQPVPKVTLLTPRPITPEEDEIAGNRRSRSAKMRVCERVEIQ